MKPEMMLVAILLPVLGGAVVPLIPFKKRIHILFIRIKPNKSIYIFKDVMIVF